MSTPSTIAAVLQQLSVMLDVTGVKFLIVDTVDGLRRLDVSTLLPADTYPTFEALNARLDNLEGALETLSATQAELTPLYHDTVPFTPEESVALGDSALEGGARDRYNVAIGAFAGFELEGGGNTVVGAFAGTSAGYDMNNCVAVGNYALAESELNLTNTTALGAYSRGTGSHQVVLGDARTDTYTAVGTHRRADTRDMADLQDTELGLDFVLQLPVVEYRFDPRDAYIDWESKPNEPAPLRAPPQAPALDSEQHEIIAYSCQKAEWERDNAQFQIDMATYQTETIEWSRRNSMKKIKPDGTEAGARTHYGFNGQALLTLCKEHNLDAAFVQDHAYNGGDEVVTVNDAQLVPIVVRAIQQLHTTLHSPTYLDNLISAMEARKAQG